MHFMSHIINIKIFCKYIIKIFTQINKLVNKKEANIPYQSTR